MEKKDFALSDCMTDYLTNFCKSGDPNGSNVTFWQPSSPKQGNVLRLGEGEIRMSSVSMFKLIKTMLINKAVGE
jgi:para-nitrobenzyl esterase